MNEPIKCVVFDFDGVILESAGVKTDAFLELYADYPEHLEAIRRHHLDHQGISRFEKFRWIAENLLHQELTEQNLIDLGSRFSSIALSKVLDAPFVPGAIELLNFLKTKAIPSYVASGTPENELREIVRQRDLSRYFVDVFGSPQCKTDILRGIAESTGISTGQMLMIGDATTDHMAANESGTQFSARATPEMNGYWSSCGIVPQNNLSDLIGQFEWV